jgi:hypothetical protein
MHYLLFVTVSMPDSATSEDARSRVYSLLSEDQSFCGPGGRFSGPLCDGFVIGGRWSGMAILGLPYQDALEQECPEPTKSHYGADDDAMLVDQVIYDHFLKPHAGLAQNIGDHRSTDFADLDGDEVDESFIGRKWLVVVDYHN